MYGCDAVEESRIKIWGIMLICGVLGVASDDLIKPCRKESNEKSTYVELDKPTELTFCVTSRSPLVDMVFTNSTSVTIGYSETKRMYFTLRRDETRHEHFLTFHLRKTALNDYRKHTITIHNVNNSQFLLNAYVKKLGLFLYKSYSLSEVTLTCESTNTSVDQVSIHYYRDQTPLTATVFGKSLVYKFNLTCSSAGRYYCRSSDKRDKEQSIDVFRDQCPPTLCPQVQSITDVLSTLGQSVTFTVCLMAYPKLSDQIVINGWKYRMNGDTQDRYLVVYRQTDMFSYVNVTINPVQETDIIKENQIKFFTSQNFQMLYGFFLTLKEGPPEFCKSSEMTPSVSARIGQHAALAFCIVQPVAYRAKILYLSVNGTVFTRSGCSSGLCVDITNVSRIGYDVKIKIVNMSLQHYGELEVKFGWGRSKGELITQVMVKPIGPPQCPHELQAVNHRERWVSVTWRPGYDGGASQTFNITLEKAGEQPLFIDKSTHITSLNGAMALTLHGLEDDTSYTLKIKPVNKYGINDGCTSKLIFKTDFLKTLNFTLTWSNDQRSVRFSCSTPSASRSLHIYKHRQNEPMVSYRPSKEQSSSQMIVTYLIPNIKCQSLGAYKCVFITDSGETVVETLNVIIDNCPPVPCENHVVTPGIIVREGYTPKVPLCLITYPGLDRSVTVNRDVKLQLPTSNNTMDIEMLLNQTGMYHYINISFRGPTVNKNTRYDFKFTSTNLKEVTYEFELIAPSHSGFSQNSNEAGSAGLQTTMLVVFLILSVLCTAIFLFVYHHRVRNRLRCVSCRSLADSTYLLGASSLSVASHSTTHGTWNPQFEDSVSCVLSNGKWIPITCVMSERSVSRQSSMRRTMKSCQEFDLNTSADNEALLMCSTCGSSVFNKSMEEQEK